MEKRSCRRKPVSMCAEIYYKGRMLVNCHIKDISLCGASLLTGPLAFFRGTEIKLKIVDFNTTTLDSNVVYGTVVRNSAHEAGIEFHYTKPHMINTILQYVTDTGLQLPSLK